MYYSKTSNIATQNGKKVLKQYSIEGKSLLLFIVKNLLNKLET